MPSVEQLNGAFEDTHRRLAEARADRDRVGEMWIRAEFASLHAELARAENTVPIRHRY